VKFFFASITTYVYSVNNTVYKQLVKNSKEVMFCHVKLLKNDINQRFQIRYQIILSAQNVNVGNFREIRWSYIIDVIFIFCNRHVEY